ncbi:methylenetetrahydrofolate reductase [Arthrobacter sp. NPDC056727]|uniref:methylenetetrahydrofolate reductase n=1 Tax=Arthrobacter sp. NPDC056727 TaxID=3345927 RepID=UPI00367082F8
MGVAESTHALLEDHSLEITAKDISNLAEAQALIPRGTRINITYLDNEDLAMRRAAAAAVKEGGFIPVPHISARRLKSEEQLKEFIGALQEDGTGSEVFVIAGDPETPMGPYRDSLDIIRSGVLTQHGVSHVGIAGYPEGHPLISRHELQASLTAKASALKEQNVPGVIVTQFGFDVDPVISWIEAVRDEGIDLPIRVGVPGPAGIKRLLGYARRFGVSSSAGIAKKYGFSIMNLMGTAGPDRYIAELASRIDPARHGDVKLHFYTFGGLSVTSKWIQEFERGA